jgi:hypothetical protein
MDADTIAAHARRAADWLVAHQRADGGWTTLETHEIDAYYKGSWALAQTGEFGAAHRCLNFVKDRFLTDYGDLEPRSHPDFHTGYPLYPNVYVVIGGMRTGRYDLVTPILRFVRSRQHPAYGGFLSERGKAVGESEMSIINTAATGIACLAAGDRDAARRAGEFVIDVIDAQPESDARFYTTCDAHGELITDVASDDEWLYLLDPSERDQYWGAHMGLPYLLLVQLGAATGEERYDERARWMFEFQQEGVDPWSVSSSGKMAWGASMRYRMTGAEEYREVATQVVEDHIVASQHEDGHWDLGENPYDASEEEMHGSIVFDISAEFTLWLALVAANFRARE